MLGGFSTNNPMASFACPSSPLSPQTPTEWKAGLMEVKRLYLQRQYKQCAARATELLEATKEAAVHPIYTAYLAFHAAISFEFLGQAAHLYSNSKVTYLHAALASFLDCLSALPESIPLPKLPTLYPTPPPSPASISQSQTPQTPSTLLTIFNQGEDDSPSPPVILDTLARMINVSLDIHDDNDPFISDSDSENQSSFVDACIASAERRKAPLKNNALFHVRLPEPNDAKKFEESIKMGSLMPSPLRVRKPSRDSPLRVKRYPSMFDTPTKSRRSSLAPRPLKPIPAGRLNVGNIKLSAAQVAESLAVRSSPSRIPRTPTKKESPTESEHTGNQHKCKGKAAKSEDITPAHMAQIVKFHRGIEFLRSQVKANISDIQKHVEKVSEIQRSRRARKVRRMASFWSFSPVTSSDEAKDEPEPGLATDEFGNVWTKETKEQRIARLRRDDWTTVGLRSPRSTWKGALYYQDFCNMVLNELCVDK
ncbi:hypothetical protein PEBR_05208 [Penicillium brasilianum]|uniref:Uncharacterized protein n=1 Tax=Penicillium brasilianum TaxID=104259 RepID=A0A1S9RXH7_PENBI|nr:hypothetical protein PEBR_05208 [Penicillium brasilianum]